MIKDCGGGANHVLTQAMSRELMSVFARRARPSPAMTEHLARIQTLKASLQVSSRSGQMTSLFLRLDSHRNPCLQCD
jgi:hypothetical protein